MDEVVEIEAKPKAKRKYTRKPHSGITITFGKRKIKADSCQITDRFLIAKTGTVSMYVALSECPTFTVDDKRSGPQAIPIVSGPAPVTLGGPAAAVAADMENRRRNMQLQAAMAMPGQFGEA